MIFLTFLSSVTLGIYTLDGIRIECKHLSEIRYFCGLSDSREGGKKSWLGRMNVVKNYGKCSRKW